jgi:hypothetical protein
MVSRALECEQATNISFSSSINQFELDTFIFSLSRFAIVSLSSIKQNRKKPFTITGKILKSSFFKCIGYCKGKMCEEDLCGHVGPKMRGELTNAHINAARPVCVYPV